VTDEHNGFVLEDRTCTTALCAIFEGIEEFLGAVTYFVRAGSNAGVVTTEIDGEFAEAAIVADQVRPIDSGESAVGLAIPATAAIGQDAVDENDDMVGLSIFAPEVVMVLSGEVRCVEVIDTSAHRQQIIARCPQVRALRSALAWDYESETQGTDG
jgi:hypothetical protein